jgi:hypothetical protein
MKMQIQNLRDRKTSVKSGKWQIADFSYWHSRQNAKNTKTAKFKKLQRALSAMETRNYKMYTKCI